MEDCLVYFEDCLVYFEDCLVYFEDCLVYFEDCLVYFEDCLVYFEDCLVYLEDCLVYFEDCLVYFEDCLVYFEDCLVYFEDCLVYCLFGGNLRWSEMYFIFVNADNGTVPLEDSAPLTLNISDANDNQPQLVLPFPPQVFLNETAPLNTLVLNVVAMDTDSGSNGELVYQLANEEGRFSVDANGVITLTATLDFETTVQYNITVTVSDRGQPQQSLTDFLIVAVTDVNDNPPVFERVRPPHT